MSKGINKKIILGLALTLVAAVSLIFLVLYSERRGETASGKFTLRLEPEEVTLRVGEYGNLSLNVFSTGYEGDIAVSALNYSWAGEEKPEASALEYEIISSSEHDSRFFIEANGELNLTIKVRWTGPAGTLYLTANAYGNYQRENEFMVSSNSVKVEIRLPI
jgi:hypothetical protein